MKIFVVKEHRLVEKSIYIKGRFTYGLEEGKALYLPPNPLEKPRLYDFSRHDYSGGGSAVHIKDIVYLRGLEDLFSKGKKLKRRKGKPKPSPHGYFYTEGEGLFPFDYEIIFEDMQDIEETDSALTYAILRGDVEHEPAQKSKDIIAKQRLCQRILDYMGKKYDLSKEVDVSARRCSGFPTPNSRKEPLGFAIFCRVNQLLYRQVPYYGKYVHGIEFKGEHELEEIIKNIVAFYSEFKGKKENG